jgi:Predicted glycosyltransferases
MDADNKNIQLSIVICTRDRCGLLEKLVKLFDQKVEIPSHFEFELLIVDNNSVDSTKEVITGLIPEKRPYVLRYISEAASGLSHARNRGIRESSFDRLCFLDDDVLPDPLFIKALSNAFDNHPGILCFTPRVIRHNENMPDWYRIDGKYHMLKRGGFDRGPHSRLLTQKDGVPIGACMIISRSLFSRFGFFNPAFGYDTSKPMMVPGEESEFFLAIQAAGIPIYYIADAVINHCPDKEKYDIMTLCKTYKGTGYWYGSSEARNLIKQRRIATWAGYPRSYYKRFVVTYLLYLMSRLSLCKTRRYYHLFEMKRTMGYFMGYKAYRK